MNISTPLLNQVMLNDHFAPLLKRCATTVMAELPAQKQAILSSLKLELRVIQEVEAMEGYATDEDFEELLFMPKVQDFLAQAQHPEQTKKAFWTLLRMRYLGMLSRAERAQVIQFNQQFCYQPTALLPELFQLTTASARLRLLSHLSYYDFAALIAATDQRAVPLNADGTALLHTNTKTQPGNKVRPSAAGTFLAR